MSLGYKVEKGIPLPKVEGMGCPRKYPFATMQPGDSFAVMGKKEFLRARAAASVHKKKFPGWFYATRATVTGGRIWRILPDAHCLLAGGPAKATSPDATRPDHERPQRDPGQRSSSVNTPERPSRTDAPLADANHCPLAPDAAP
jgi:hypothetical protein